MANSILFIQQKKSFLMGAIATGLEQEGYKVFNSDFSKDSIDAHFELSSNIFIFIEPEVMIYSEYIISLLKGAINSIGKRIFIMGNPEQADVIGKEIGLEYIEALFYRPINAKEVIERVTESLHKDEDVEGKKTILVVDDSGTFLHTIKQWLETKFKVALVNSATNAITYLGKSIPDLILLDYDMPICSGPQMLEMLRNDSNLSNVPVIFLTAKGDRESITKVLSLKPEGYLLKSLPKDKIIEAIDEFFSKRDSK